VKREREGGRERKRVWGRGEPQGEEERYIGPHCGTMRNSCTWHVICVERVSAPATANYYSTCANACALARSFVRS